MEFDEYDYLEKTVENPELSSANGNGALADERRHKSSRRGDGDGEGPSKRPRTDDDRERHRDRGSSRDRKERDRHRSSRERRDDRGGGRERERERERDHDRGGRERDGERPGRGRSHSERRREEEPDRHREKSKEREREREKEKEKEKEREKERERERESRERDRDREGRSLGSRRYTRATFGWSIWLTEEHRRHKEKKEAAEPEADPERDQRTVFAYQINLKADERDVYEFFSRAGKVRDVRLIMDRNSRRSKGVGYIEFYDAMSVPMAIALTGQKLLGQAVMVKPSEAEKNLVHSSTSGAAAAGAQASGARKLYVGNLHFNITEDQLRQVFEPFGTVELVQMPLDPLTGHCKGFGFVQFARLEDAKAAQSLNGQLEIAGRTIKVSAVTDQIGMQDAGATARDLDDDEGGGLALNAQSRALLMQKLDRSGTATSVNNLTPAAPGLPLPMPSAGVSPVAPMVQTGLSGLVGLPGTAIPAVAAAVPAVDPIGVPSECLLLKNMFDPNTETEPDFDLDIKEDVQDECSKYGPLKHIYVEKNSAGFVYLRFASATSAVTAQRSLHGRWFAGKMITATFIPPHTYEARFPGGDS